MRNRELDRMLLNARRTAAERDRLVGTVDELMAALRAMVEAYNKTGRVGPVMIQARHAIAAATKGG